MLTCALLTSCSGGKTQDPKARPPGPELVRRLDPAELIPADLDLVIRIDMARMRAAIGAPAADSLAARGLERAGDDLLKNALACADVVWLGARVGEIEAGDHVVVVEGRACAPSLDPKRWKRLPSANGELAMFEREGDHAPRAGTARILLLGQRATAFVSPVEVDSVARVVRDGPDARRGSPTAEGIVSVDVKSGRLPVALERRFPSIAAIVAGLDRLRASAVMIDEGLQIDAEILSPTSKGAERALRFLEALRDNMADPRLALVMKRVRLEQVEHTVRLRVVLPAQVILGWLSDQDADTGE